MISLPPVMNSFKLNRLRFARYGNAVPLQAWTGQEGSRKLWLPDFVTTAQDGGRLSALRTRQLYSQEILLVLISDGDRGGTVVKVLSYKLESLVQSRLVSLEFFIDIKYFRSYYGPGVDSASNIN